MILYSENILDEHMYAQSKANLLSMAKGSSWPLDLDIWLCLSETTILLTDSLIHS
jgi:hypothetical protein